MDDAGQKLKRVRERLDFRYRDVEEFSQQIAERRRNSEFCIAISRLSDIENRGVVPNIYKLFSLCAIYKLEVAEVMGWYGVEVGDLVAEGAQIRPERSAIIGFGQDPMSRFPAGELQVPLSLDPGMDLSKTTFLSRFIQSWGVLPMMLVSGMDLKNHRYAFVGTGDHFMSPLLLPGSLLLIDETRRKVATSGWTSEYDRPIYFLEHRDGWTCAWCSLAGDKLIAHPHPVSTCTPLVFTMGTEVDVVGQVMGVANRLDAEVRSRTRS